MKLLFDESLSPRLVLLLSDLFPESKVRFETGWRVLAIAGSWNTLSPTASSWCRRTEISNVL
jgi:hypothetical protein